MYGFRPRIDTCILTSGLQELNIIKYSHFDNFIITCTCTFICALLGGLWFPVRRMFLLTSRNKGYLNSRKQHCHGRSQKKNLLLRQCQVGHKSGNKDRQAKSVNLWNFEFLLFEVHWYERSEVSLQQSTKGVDITRNPIISARTIM